MTTNKKHNEIMQKTIELATLSVNNGTGPFGCIITDENYNIISSEHNNVTTANDPTAHAEINAIRIACSKLKKIKLQNVKLFTSCEPCPMCLGAIYWAGITEIYYSNTREEAKNIGFDDEYIYDEIQKKIEDRNVKLIKISCDNSLESFKLWQNKSDKINY